MFREFRSGPRGVFLKKGKTIGGGADPDGSRLFYGKSFIYPFFAWPFVRVLGTSGFLVFNLACSRWRLHAPISFLPLARARSSASCWRSRFVFATAVPVYVVWMMPELFNLTIGMGAYFFWLFKEVSPRAAPVGAPGFAAP